MGPHLGMPTNVNVIYTSLKSTFSVQQFRCRHLAIDVSKKCELAHNYKKIWTYSSSRSSKVINLGDNQKCMCNFLLVISSNFGRICTIVEVSTYKARK